MKKIAAIGLLALAGASGTAMAGEFSCKVYCITSGGSTQSTQVSLQANSREHAAQIIDRQSDKICRDAGYYKSTSSTMSASQCSAN